MSEITAFLQSKYGSYGERGRAISDRLEQLWADHRNLADSHFLGEFCSGDDAKFVQRYSEMRVGELLRGAGWQLSSSDEGPDFKAVKDDDRTWVEVVAPNAGTGADRLRDDYLTPSLSGGIGGCYVPADQIVLRVCAAIEAKHKKLVGYTDKKGKYHSGYQGSGLVQPHEAYVIAVNTALLGFCGDVGSSPFPSIVDAVFPAGPMEAVLDRDTLQVRGQGVSHRPVIWKVNKAAVSTDLFLQVAYKPVSAILGLHERPEESAPRRPTVLHNPLALNQLADGWCGPAYEYRAVVRGTHWELTMLDAT